MILLNSFRRRSHRIVVAAIIAWLPFGVVRPAEAVCAPCAFGVYEVGALLLGGGAAIGGVVLLNEDRPRIDYPETPLPRGEDGELLPDCDDPHIQLGEACSKRSGARYPQARRYGEGGQPEYDYDFTDHGRPHDHPNPHRHPWLPTQGGPKRGPAEPIPAGDDIPWPNGYGE